MANKPILITFEILLVVVAPLLLLYLRGTWPLQKTIPCLVSIPVLWYLTYAPIHELSHAATTHAVGGRVIEMKLIPRFWLGEFGRARITPVGITEDWQQAIMTASPYIVDVVSFLVALLVLRRSLTTGAFAVGFLFMFLCLRPAFDFVCEPQAFLAGNKGDLYHIDALIGSRMMWLLLLLSMGFAFFTIVKILKRFAGHPLRPNTLPVV